MESNFRDVKYRFFLALIVLVMIIAACGQSGITPRPYPTRPTTRLVMDNNLGATEIWRVSSLRVGANTIIVTPHHILLNNAKDRLVSYDPATGVVKWKTKYEGGGSSISVDDKKLYVASPGEPLLAYDLETGNKVWSGPMLAVRRGHALSIRDGVLVDLSDVIRLFNPETGELLREEAIVIVSHSSPAHYIMQIEGTELRQSREALMRIEHNTRKIIWQIPFGDAKGRILRFPTVSDNNVLVLVTTQAIERDLHAIDFETGRRLWKINGDFVSNAAVVDGKIYILRDDARLMVLDELTGAELGYIQFSPAETEAGIGEVRFWVGADDQGRIFVYFSDSEELIALKVGQQAPNISEPVIATTIPLATIQPTLAPVTDKLDLLAGTGDSVEVVGVYGNYAYLGIGPNLVSMDVTHPADPVLVGQTPLPTVVRDGVIAGSIAYLAVEGGLRLFDISNPAMPTEIGRFETPKPVYIVAIDEEPLPDNAPPLIYLGGVDGEMYVVDVSQPDAPVQVGFYRIPGEANRIINIAVDSTTPSTVTAYIIVASQGMYIIDVTNPATPNQMGFYTVPMSSDVAVKDNFVYLTDAAHGLRIIDVSNSATPIEISDHQIGKGADRVAIVEDIAYVTEFTDLITDDQPLHLIDMSNPWMPVQIGEYTIPTEATNILVTYDNVSAKPRYAYIGTLARGLRIVDIFNPAAPTEIGFYNSPVTTISSSPPLIPTVVPGPPTAPTPSSDGLICIFDLCLRLYE